MTGGEDVAFSCIFNSVIMMGFFLPSFSCLRGCSGHGTEAGNTLCTPFHSQSPFILMYAAEVLSEWHAPVWGSSFLSVGRPIPLLGMSTAWYPSRQMKCLSHRKPGCEQQYFRGEVLWVARVSLNMHQLRERTPEVWDFFPGATVTCWWTEAACFFEKVWTSNTST